MNKSPFLPCLILHRTLFYPLYSRLTKLTRALLGNSVDLSVVIPAYNESERISSMLDETLTFLREKSRKERFSFEVIVCDDGSRDSTVAIAQKYNARYGSEYVRVKRLSTNVGKGGAVKSGVMVSRGRWILMADADGATRFADFENLHKVAIKNALSQRKNNYTPTSPQGVNAKTKVIGDASDSGSMVIVVGSRDHYKEDALVQVRSDALHMCRCNGLMVMVVVM